VEDQPEPELAGLVSDDEKQLVVVRRRRLRMLKSNELRNVEVIGVSELRSV
jgi:hypothetical protein